MMRYILLFLLYPLMIVPQEMVVKITGTSLEELMNIRVTSVSKKEEKLRQAPAAVFVLPGEEIRRAGVTTLPDALRLVPGVQVARIDASKWAVSIRGFNSRTSQKLLVLIDGRSVYNQLFSGVFWEVQDVLLEDIDRIEVIRGPGGTLWGANAVNGVINIITKDARLTQGGRITAGGGNEEKGFGSGRYGWEPAPNIFLRVYGKYFERDQGYHPVRAFDEWQMARGGFRMDVEKIPQHQFTLQGDIYEGKAGERLTPTTGQDVGLSGANVIARWHHTPAPRRELRLQFYYDFTDYDNQLLRERRHTLDVDFQHHIGSIVWGTGYRYSRDRMEDSDALPIEPDRRSTGLFNAYVQAEQQVRRLKVVVGSKFEHNEYSGLEIQPNIRLSLPLASTHHLWAALSRAVRTPSRLESDLFIGGMRLGQDFDSEILLAYEAGYRAQPHRHLFIDLAAFFHQYDRLLSIEQNFKFANLLNGETYGLEVAAKWQASPRWRIEGTYSFLQMDIFADPGSIDTARAATVEGGNPHHQATLQTSLTPLPELTLTTALRYVDILPAANVPSYLLLDLNAGWSPGRNLELFISAQNLLKKHHFEQGGSQATGLQTGFYGKIIWRF